jgi:chorismate mutase
MADEHLEALRAELDGIDDELVDTLARRQETVKRVAHLKARTKAPLRDVLREARQMARLAERARSKDLDELFVVRVFREIVDFSVRTQEAHLGMTAALDPGRPITVVFQGADGAFSHIAARRFFAPRPSTVTYRGLPTFRAMLEEVRSGSADYAMLPIENTTSGSVHDAYDALSHTDLAIVGEEVLRIEMCLVGIADVPLESLRKVYSHPQALSQCTAFLASLPQCTVETFIDTAMSVERVKREAIRPTWRSRAPKRRRSMVSTSCGATSPIIGKLHAFPRDRPRKRAARSARALQDVGDVRDGARARRAARLPQRDCRARPEPDEARIAPAPRPAVRVFVLRRVRRQRRRRPRAARTRRNQRAHQIIEDLRVISRENRDGGIVDIGVSGYRDIGISGYRGIGVSIGPEIGASAS